MFTELYLIRQRRIGRVNRDGCVRVHIEQRSLDNIDHLISPGGVDCDLEMSNHDPEVPPEAEREITKGINYDLGTKHDT